MYINIMQDTTIIDLDIAWHACIAMHTHALPSATSTARRQIDIADSVPFSDLVCVQDSKKIPAL